MNTQEYRNAIVSEIDARKSHEASKNAANDSIQTCLNALKKAVDFDNVADVMIASNVNAAFLNRNERSNARFNVYAAEKVVNIARSLAACATLNHYTRAILATALALEANDSVLTHKDAVAACSQSVKHSDSKREKIIKETRYAKHIAPSTASTQSSSSINALQTFNVLTEERDASNVVCYRVNRDSALVAALQQ